MLVYVDGLHFAFLILLNHGHHMEGMAALCGVWALNYVIFLNQEGGNGSYRRYTLVILVFCFWLFLASAGFPSQLPTVSWSLT